MWTCYWCGQPTTAHSFGHWQEPGFKDCLKSFELMNVENALIVYDALLRTKHLPVPPPSGWVSWNVSQAIGTDFRVVLATDGLLYDVNPRTGVVRPRVSTPSQAAVLTPTLPVIPAKAPPRPCKFKPGDKVRWQNKPTLPHIALKSYGTVISVKWDPDSSPTYGYDIITTVSCTFGHEYDLELDVPVKPAHDAPIALKTANARPKHPKMPCCGFCGELVVSIYTASHGIVRGCDVHGPGVPEITLNKEQHP